MTGGVEMRKSDEEYLDLFCAEYLKDLDRVAAYRRMLPERAKKMTPNAVRQMAKKWYDKAVETGVLDQKKAELCYKAEVEAEWVINKAVQGLNMCLEGTPVIDFKGNQVYAKTDKGELAAVYKFDSKGAAAFAKMLGQYNGVFTDKVEVNTKTGLAELLREREKKANGEG